MPRQFLATLILAGIATSCAQTKPSPPPAPAGSSSSTTQPQVKPGSSRPSIAAAPSPSCAPTRADYPSESLRANEQGTTRIRFSINSEGSLIRTEVLESSGYPRLDEVAVRKLAECKFRAGKDANGVPIGGTFDVKYTWKIE
jgi:periplasmic protein TonB